MDFSEIGGLKRDKEAILPVARPHRLLTQALAGL
jgi:hypothetical protein